MCISNSYQSYSCHRPLNLTILLEEATTWISDLTNAMQIIILTPSPKMRETYTTTFHSHFMAVFYRNHKWWNIKVTIWLNCLIYKVYWHIYGVYHSIHTYIPPMKTNHLLFIYSYHTCPTRMLYSHVKQNIFIYWGIPYIFINDYNVWKCFPKLPVDTDWSICIRQSLTPLGHNSASIKQVWADLLLVHIELHKIRPMCCFASHTISTIINDNFHCRSVCM